MRRSPLLLVALACVACGDDAKPQEAQTQTAATTIDAATIAAVEKLEPWDGDEDEAELYGAVITATACAELMTTDDTGDAISRCSPADAARTGFVLYDPSEQAVFYLKHGGLYQFELERGFGGSIDVSGTIIGKKSGIPVIDPEEYTITPKPAAGAFKGCL